MIHGSSLRENHKYCKRLKIQLTGNEPLTLGFIYIPPEDSNVHLYFEEPLFDTINEEIFEFKDQGQMLILGDFNARLGNLKDDQDLEELSSFWKLDLSPRHNIDQTSNTFGMELLQLCYKQNMKILNGRWGDKSDKWTYFSDTGGTSVIDWALANEKLMKNILNFEIGDDLHISDHTNLKVSIDINIAKQQDSLETSTANCYSIPLEDIFPHERGFKMDAKSRANLLGRLNSAKFHNEIQSLLRHISTNQENPIENINLFTQWLNELSNEFFKKK